jgi:beta-1,2-mannosyltransferase
MPLKGYVNKGIVAKSVDSEVDELGDHDPCSPLAQTHNIQVQENFHTDDDMVAIAGSLKDHILIDYEGQDRTLTHNQIVAKTWLRMAQSSVWMERYQVYLTVTRVLFYTQGVRHWPKISFLRGQIHDENWIELVDYTLEWNGKHIQFPTIFDIPFPYVKGGAFYGPEDPRIIIEQGLSDTYTAEPIIIFNMKSMIEGQDHWRAMHLF